MLIRIIVYIRTYYWLLELYEHSYYFYLTFTYLSQPVYCLYPVVQHEDFMTMR